MPIQGRSSEKVLEILLEPELEFGGSWTDFHINRTKKAQSLLRNKSKICD